MKQRVNELGRTRLLELGAMFLNDSKVDPALLGAGVDKVLEFMKHVGSAAPRLKDADGNPLLRWQDAVIEEDLPDGCSVLDLGCGNGELLAHLIERKKVAGQGVELDPEAVAQCIERGVPVFQANLDEGLKGFPEKRFDYVILEETLQTLNRPAEVLREMLRVGRRGIVSFPNFGYWRVRLDLVVRGRMPVTEWLPHRWYDTPNIHLLSLQDFLEWGEEEGVRILHGHALAEGTIRDLEAEDNLHAEEVLLVFESKDA
jgi:methionine biosynthesis protein MetW